MHMHMHMHARTHAYIRTEVILRIHAGARLVNHKIIMLCSACT